MPRVSVRRLLLYVAYSLVATTLVMLALHVHSQPWLRMMEPVAGAQGDPGLLDDQQPNPKEQFELEEVEELSSTLPDIGQEEQSSSNSSSNSAFRRHGLPWYIKDDGYRPLPEETVLTIWPGRNNGDRIENQLMIPDGGPPDAPVKRIYLPNGLSAWQVKSGRKVFLDQKCPVDRCSLTAKRDDAATADAIMFKGKSHDNHNRSTAKQVCEPVQSDSTTNQ